MKKSNADRVYLESYILQKDYRIRLPKIVEGNLDAIPGKTYFDIFFDAKREEIILKLASNESR